MSIKSVCHKTSEISDWKLVFVKTTRPTGLLVTSSPDLNIIETEVNQDQLSFNRTAVVSMIRFIVMFIFFTTFSEPSWLHVGPGDVCCETMRFNTKLHEILL